MSLRDRWPLMLKRTHFDIVAALRRHYQHKVDAEYIRARDEGRAQVHLWAVEVNSNLVYGTGPFQDMATWHQPRVAAALQSAEHQFSPARTKLEAHIVLPKETN